MNSHSAVKPVPYRKHVDAMGRAFAGSQRQIQTYVNEHSAELSEAVRHSLSFGPIEIEWVSPLSARGYVEYQDGDFLRVLGLDNLTNQLREFWPSGGPCWDALARIAFSDGRRGCILVEAKSHEKEIEGNGCGATDASLQQILRALCKTKEWLEVSPAADWTGKLYQSANRLAHLYFLRKIAGIDAYLLNVYFMNDSHWQNSAKTVQEWKPAIQDVQRRLGLTSPVPFSEEVFLDAQP